MAILIDRKINKEYKFQDFSTPGSFTWVKPASVTEVEVTIQGAGGCGGWGDDWAGGYSGGGGGAGAVYVKKLVQVTANVAVVVGAGGVGTTGPMQGNGGSTSFGTLTVLGGSFGRSGWPPESGPFGTGGNGGGSVNGATAAATKGGSIASDLFGYAPGAGGGSGMNVVGTSGSGGDFGATVGGLGPTVVAGHLPGGGGASSYFGTGGAGSQSTVGGNGATGAGGGGGRRGSDSMSNQGKAGGNGGNGFCRVEWYE